MKNPSLFLGKYDPKCVSAQFQSCTRAFVAPQIRVQSFENHLARALTCLLFLVGLTHKVKPPQPACLHTLRMSIGVHTHLHIRLCIGVHVSTFILLITFPSIQTKHIRKKSLVQIQNETFLWLKGPRSRITIWELYQKLSRMLGIAEMESFCISLHSYLINRYPLE